MNNLLLVATKDITLKNFFLPLIDEYSKKRIKITIICNDVHNIKFLLNNKNYQSIRYLDLNFPTKLNQIINLFGMIKKIRSLRKFLKKEDINILHLNTPIASHMFRIANIFLKNKVIYHVHGFRFHKKGNYFKNLFNFTIEYFLNFLTNEYITINIEDKNIVDKFFKKKCYLIKGLGLDFDVLNKFYVSNENTNNKKIKIGIIGAYKKEKGYLDIIKLAHKVKDNKNIIFDCYGYGNINYYNKLKKKYQLNNLFLNPYIDNIYNKIKNFDILIHPSKREGLAVSILESMALGIPVITTRIRGCEDLVDDYYNGRLYTPGNIDELYEIILDFISNKKKFIEYSKISRKIVKENYDAKKISKEIVEVVI